MGVTHVTVTLKGFGSEKGTYEAEFLVDTGATDSLVAGAELTRIGVKPAGKMAYELADGTLREYSFGLVEIAFMGEVTAGRVIFGPDSVKPLLGVTALESVGITVDPTTRTLKRLPAIPLKQELPRSARSQPMKPICEYEVGPATAKGRLRSRPSMLTKLAPEVGFEPTTLRLTAGCSTVELLRNKFSAPAKT